MGTDGGACRPAFARTAASWRSSTSMTNRHGSAVTEQSRRTLIADRTLWSYYPAYSPDGLLHCLLGLPEHHQGRTGTRPSPMPPTTAASCA
ncbi:MAG: hypothetical protein R2712_29405 [Vicinamibacterales bacterium]